jgi:hypothetical protein
MATPHRWRPPCKWVGLGDKCSSLHPDECSEFISGDDEMQLTRQEREWHLRNVVETTKGRDLIRTLYEKVKNGKKTQATDDSAESSKELNAMIEAILADEYPA